MTTIKERIATLKRLDAARNKPGVPMDQYRDASGAIADNALEIISGLSNALDDIQRVVDKQAEDEALWSVPLDRLQPISEAYLQQELRGLHAVIEYHTKPAINQDARTREPS